MIELESYDAQLVADCFESGMGVKQTMEQLNDYWTANGMAHVGESTMLSAFHRLRPNVVPVTKWQQGSIDTDCDWCKANFNWNAQLHVRTHKSTGEPTPADAIELLKNEDGAVPECLKAENLSEINPLATHFWDEVHTQVKVGKISPTGTKMQCLFKRNKEGKLDSNGSFAEGGHQLNMKCPQEARFSCGVALKKLADGSLLGVRLPTHECSCCTLLTEKDCEAEMIQKESKHPNTLKGKCKP